VSSVIGEVMSRFREILGSLRLSPTALNVRIHRLFSLDFIPKDYWQSTYSN